MTGLVRTLSRGATVWNWASEGDSALRPCFGSGQTTRFLGVSETLDPDEFLTAVERTAVRDRNEAFSRSWRGDPLTPPGEGPVKLFGHQRRRFIGYGPRVEVVVDVEIPAYGSPEAVVYQQGRFHDRVIIGRAPLTEAGVERVLDLAQVFIASKS